MVRRGALEMLIIKSPDDIPTRNLFRHGNFRAFHLYHALRIGVGAFEDIMAFVVYFVPGGNPETTCSSGVVRE